MVNLEVPSPQAVELPNSRVPGRSGIWRNVLSVSSLTTPHVTNPIKTAYEAFVTGHRLNPNHACLGHREWDPTISKWSGYIWETYEEIRQRRDNFGAGLMHIYRDVVKGTKSSQFCVGILSINRVEWIITDLACQAYSLISVALYDTLGHDSTEYIVNLTEMEIIVAAVENIPKLLTIKEKLPLLKVIISMDSLRGPTDSQGRSKLDLLSAWGKTKGVVITEFRTVENSGKARPLPHIVPTPETILTINFTSGTTGNPKGVVLNHENGAACAIGPMGVLQPHITSKEPPVVLSFLPLAHIYERGNTMSSFMRGATIGMYHGVMTELIDDIQTLKPTIMMTVPRLLLRVEAGIRAATINAPGAWGRLSRRAYAAKLAQMEAGGTQYHWLWDRVWSKKLQQFMGGRLEIIISGSAPLPKDTTRFLRAALACEIFEGFGMTETTACGLLSHPGDRVIGHVGPPMPHVEVALQDVPSMGYLSTDKPFPRGELLMRGMNRLVEYYKEPGKTSEAIDSDGWMHSGDVAMIDNEGRVYIIDRVKNIFKLSQGEYVAAERLEAMYSSCPLIAQVFIHGDSFQSYIVAVVVVDPAAFSAFASKILGDRIAPTDRGALVKACADLKVRKAMVQELAKVAQEKELAGFEKIKNVYLTVEPFTIENDCLTPSFKLKRPQATKMYKKELEALYAEGELVHHARPVLPAKL